MGGISSYLYFYNKEVLSDAALENISTETVEEAADVVVDISGAIDRPGVFTLASGSRLADLVNSAGGVTTEVSQKWLSRNLNLASILKDQQKIYIPFEWEVISSFPEYELKELALESTPPSNDASSGNVDDGTNSADDTSDGTDATSDGTTDTLINLNTATKEELETLPKIGEVTAEKIIDFRPYADFEDLQEKAGIADSVIEAIRDLVTF